MKAWEVKNKYEGFNAEIVFATTAGKAKTLALSISQLPTTEVAGL